MDLVFRIKKIKSIEHSIIFNRGMLHKKEAD